MSESPSAVLKQSRWHASDLAPIVSLLVIVVFFTIVADGFVSFGTLTLVLQQGSVLAIVAAGLTFVLLSAEIDLSVGTMALLAACLCGVLYEQSFATPPQESVAESLSADAGLAADAASSGRLSSGMTFLVLVIPLAGALGLGLVSGALTVASRLPSFIITLAMMNIADGLARYLTKSEKFDVPDVLKTLGNQELHVGSQIWIPLSALLAAGVLIAGHIVLQHTRFGRYVYMTGGNREAARLAGIRTHRIVIACLAISAVTAGVGGLVNAGRLESVSLDQNADLLLDAVACVVLGGTSLFGGEGGMGRTLIGVATFTVLKVGLNMLRIDTIADFDLLRPFLMGVVLMIALVINGSLTRRRRD